MICVSLRKRLVLNPHVLPNTLYFVATAGPWTPASRSRACFPLRANSDPEAFSDLHHVLVLCLCRVSNLARIVLVSWPKSMWSDF
jgi:hypothetical protein